MLINSFRLLAASLFIGVSALHAAPITVKYSGPFSGSYVHQLNSDTLSAQFTDIDAEFIFTYDTDSISTFGAGTRSQITSGSFAIGQVPCSPLAS